MKSTLMRNLMDNMYNQNFGRYAVLEGQANLDDLLTQRPGGVVRVKSPNAVMPLTTPALEPYSFQMLEYLDGVRESRAGVSRMSQGMNENALTSHTTATAVNAVMTAAQSRVELIARNFAETGVKDLMITIYELLLKNQDKEMIAKIDGKFQNFIQQCSVDVPAKFQSWTNAVAGDVNPNNMGGATNSKGNNKPSELRDNLFFMSSEVSEEIQPVVDVMEDGSLAVKFGNTDAVRLSEIGNTFSIDFLAQKQYLDFLAINEQDAIAGKPVNKVKNKGIVKSIFKNDNTVLSGFFDNFYGESVFDSLPNHVKNETWMHPESEDFDVDRVRNEVLGFYEYKLNEAHKVAVPQKDVSAMSAKEILNKLA